MTKKLLKLTGLLIALIFILMVTGALLFRIYSPQYFIPYVIEQVEEETNGRYTLAINSDSVRVRLLTMNLNLGYTEFKRDSSISHNSGIEFLDKFDVYVTFQSFDISAFHLINFILRNRINVDRVAIEQPDIVIRKNADYSSDDNIENTDSIARVSIDYEADSVLADTVAWEQFDALKDTFTPYIRVDSFLINNASFAFFDGRKSYPIQQVNGLDFNLIGFISDKHDDITVEDASISIDSASSLVSKNIARLSVKGVSIHPDSVHLDELHFKHIVDPYRINRIKGFRASWLDVALQNINIQGIHPGKLISDSVMNIDKTRIGFVNLYLFKDKEALVINPAHKALPSEQVRSIPMPVMVDTLIIDDGKIVIDMEAPQATKPGRLMIDDMNAQILNITNIPSELKKNSHMKFHVVCDIEDSIEVDLKVDFDIPSPEDNFFLSCDVQPFQAINLNGFLGSQFFIEFPKGRINYLHFEFEGNNKANVGTMDLEYQDLKVRKLQDYQKYMEGKPNTGFIAGIGNILIPVNRSRQTKGYKQAVVYYEKEYNRDFVHGTIMSLVSGVASSVGFASKNLDKKQQKASELDETSTQLSAEKVLQKAEDAAAKENK